MFFKGFEVEGILGAIISKDGKITMGIKYKGTERTEWLPSSFVKKRFEQLAIKFYEETFDCRTNSFPTISCHFGKYLMRRIPPNLLSDDEED